MKSRHDLHVDPMYTFVCVKKCSSCDHAIICVIITEFPLYHFQSTYCNTMVKHGEAAKRVVHVVNLDPAAEAFDYPVMAGKMNQ